MRTRSVLATALVTVALFAALPISAQAKTTEQLDRRLFDATPDRTAGSWHMAGLTAGPLGGALDLTITAPDGSLPTTPGACEAVDVAVVLTVSPGEVLTINTTGEACAHIIAGTLTVNAFFDTKDVTYTGTEHKKAKIVGDGLIAAGEQFFGSIANVSTTVAW